MHRLSYTRHPTPINRKQHPVSRQQHPHITWQLCLELRTPTARLERHPSLIRVNRMRGTAHSNQRERIAARARHRDLDRAAWPDLLGGAGDGWARGRRDAVREEKVGR